MKISYDILGMNKKDKTGNTLNAMLELDGEKIIGVYIHRTTYQLMMPVSCRLGFGCKYVECDLEDVLVRLVDKVVSRDNTQVSVAVLTVIAQYIVHPELSILINERKLEEDTLVNKKSINDKKYKLLG